MSPGSRVPGTGGTKVMVSNLPLLFARGSPTSLESMRLEELQLFLKFVLRCEQNSPSLDLESLAKPAWWPSAASWDIQIFSKKEQRGKTSSILRSAIKACYTYHECLYLLEFCRKLITFTGGIENLQVVDNRDGTRSLLNRTSKKLLVTFRAENQDYDKEHFKHSGISKTSKGQPQLGNVGVKKQLVNRVSDNTSDPNLTKCVDVYLCDSCDKDFDVLSDLVAHERVCGVKETDSSLDGFLSGLKLHRVGQSLPKREIKKNERPRASNYDKFMEIDLSSPLGKYIVSSSGLSISQMNPASRGYKSLEEYNIELDAKCPGTLKSLKNSNAFMDIRGKWTSSYKLSRKKANLWTHTYCFTAAQLEAKVRTMKSGLSPGSLQNYRKCQKKQPSVRLKRLTAREIESPLKRKLVPDKQESPQTLSSVKKVKNTARKSFSGYQNSIERDPENERVIDELLEDSEDELKDNIDKTAEKNVPKNQIVTFASGFRTLEVSKIKEEVDMDTGVKNVKVPRPLPELQKIYVRNSQSSSASQSQSKEIDLVDLCSSDED